MKTWGMVLTTHQSFQEARSVKNILNTASITALIFGSIWILLAFLSIDREIRISRGVDISTAIDIGILLMHGIIDILIYKVCKALVNIVDMGRYEDTSRIIMTWIIIAFVVGWFQFFIVGFLISLFLLIAYAECNDLIRKSRETLIEPTALPPPPPFY